MANKIQLRRGLEANLPTLDAGEPAFTTDSYKLFIGDGSTNHEIGGGGGSIKYFMARNGSSTQVLPKTTWTKLTTALGEEDFDPNGWYDASNARFQPDESGIYLVGAFSTLVLDDGAKYVVGCYKNGALYGLFGRGTSGKASEFGGFGGSLLVQMNGTTDYIEVYVYHSNSADTNSDTHTRYNYFWGLKIA